MVDVQDIEPIKEIKFFNDMDNIKQDFRGHSRALRYVCTKENNKYFVKIYESNRMKDINNINNIYSKLQIPIAKTIEMGYIETLNKTYVVYEYIEGNTLYELARMLNIEDLEKIGIKIGRELKKFQEIIGDKEKFKEEFDKEINDLMCNSIELKRFYEDNSKMKLPYIDMDRLFESFSKLKEFIYIQNPTFIHNDINFKNVIVKDEIPYFIDIDGGKIKSRALDFRGNCWYGWTGDNLERDRAVYRGIYRGLFDGEVPMEFHKELGFTMIYEFLLRLKQYGKDIEQIEYSFNKFKPIFDKTCYFEDYIFEWF